MGTLGPRCREALLAGGVRDSEVAYLAMAMSRIGRVYDVGTHRSSQAVAQHELARRAGLQPTTSGGQRYGVPIAFLTDRANMAQWVNGTWKLLNKRYHDPLVRSLMCVGELLAQGARPATDRAEWTWHVEHELKREADMQARLR